MNQTPNNFVVAVFGIGILQHLLEDQRIPSYPGHRKQEVIAQRHSPGILLLATSQIGALELRIRLLQLVQRIDGRSLALTKVYVSLQTVDPPYEHLPWRMVQQIGVYSLRRLYKFIPVEENLGDLRLADGHLQVPLEQHPNHVQVIIKPLFGVDQFLGWSCENNKG